MKILFLPCYEGEETSERSGQLLKILKRRHEVVFLKPRDRWFSQRASWPLRAWERIRIIHQLIQEGKKLLDVDLIFGRDCAYALPAMKIAKYLNKPYIWESEGSMKDLWDHSHAYPVQVIPWIFLEGYLAKRTDHMITVTENDRRAYIQQGMNPDHIHLIPVCIYTDKRSKKTKQEARHLLSLPRDEPLFLFFSHFNYPPNQTALHFLNKNVAPHLPGRLLLCGHGKLPKKLHPKIQYLGFLQLEGLYDLIRASDICLAPVWEANGTLTKILDMLVHSAPTVITPAAHRGIPELQDGIHCLIAKDKEDFVQKTLLLAGNKSLQGTIGHAASKIIQEKYNWELYEDKLLKIVESVAQKNV